MDESVFNYKAICCDKIPDAFLDKLIAKKYFSKFGRVNRFILRPGRLSCTVEYETEQEAKEAVMQAGQYNKHVFEVNYAKRDVRTVHNTEDWVNPEVQSELEAMGGVRYQSAASVMPPVQQMRAPLRTAMPVPVVRATRPVETNTNGKMPIGVKQELQALMRKPALTDEAKFRVLDARDKLLRLTQVRNTDIKKASSTRGTCPDMCPEKERWMREFQRQVSYFEAEQGGSFLSHTRAIKEYSRSSADQEIPLSHELRPEGVLHMTMQYLLHEIVDLCNEPHISLSDWYHFVWDRTRSIRKDITQQELCSVQAVELVEQCARFHIHCAARLVAEDYAVFDKKINAENLTKCLQTLKYMYHDLRLKKIHCACEAEFRSYIVLNNLGNANFLWELKQLPQHIQNAPEIKRAIAFYNALQHNNYVRFFSMIREAETSYLSACILLSYFNKLRFMALSVINKSYNWRKFGVYLPTEYFVKILGFESIEAAVGFLEYHGVQANGERVMLSAPQAPDIEYSMERAINLVESKRLVSVGECIAGKPLESAEIYTQHQPHNSFDANGMLKAKAINASDQNGLDTILVDEEEEEEEGEVEEEQEVVEVEEEQPIVTKTPEAPAKVQTNFSNFKFTAPTNQQVQPSTGLFSFKNVAPATQATTTAFDGGNLFSKPFAENATNKTGGSMFGNIFQFATQNVPEVPQTVAPANEAVYDDEDAHSLKQLEDSELDEEEDDDLVSEENDYVNSSFNAQDIEEDAARENVNEMLLKKEQEFAELKQQLEQEIATQAENLLETILSSVLKQTVQDELEECVSLHNVCSEKAKSVLTQHINAIIAQLAQEELQHFSHERALMQRVFLSWLEVARKQSQKRKILQSLPVYITTDTREEQTAKICIPNQCDNISLIKRYRYGTACDFARLLDTREAQSPTINIFALLSEHLPHISQSGRLNVQKYFKLVISLPDNDEASGISSWCDKLLLQCLGPAQQANMYVYDLKLGVALCVRKIVGLQHCEFAEHADAVLFFVQGLEEVHKTKQRLEKILQNSKALKSMSLAIMQLPFGGGLRGKQLLAALQLERLRYNYRLSAYEIFSAETQLSAALKFVAKKLDVSEWQKLELQYVHNYLDCCLGTEMWQRWQQSANDNPVFAEACNKPQKIIDLYNEALQRVAVMLQQDFTNYAEFPEELHKFVRRLPVSDIPLSLEHFPANWKQAAVNKQLTRVLQDLRLPACQNMDNIDTQDLNELGGWCAEYILKALPDHDNAILEKSYEYMRRFLIWCNLEHINFLPFMRDMAHLRAKILLRDRQKILNEFVVYERQALLQYLEQPWWLNCAAVSDIDLASKMSIEASSRHEVIEEDSMQQDNVDAVLEYAENVLKSVQKKKHKLLPDRKNEEINMELNKSLRDFELTKLLGGYEVPSEELKRQPLSTQNGNEEAVQKKRKLNKVENEIEAVLKKAQTIIDKYDSRHN